MRACSLAVATLFILAAQVVLAQDVAAEAEGPAGVRVVFVRDGVFASPGDPAWQGIPEATFDLSAQQITPPVGGGSIAKVAVRAMHDGEELAIRLEWADASADRGVGVDTFRDAAAVGFPVGRPKTAPSPFMGDPDNPVVIWQWAADFDANAEGKSRFGARYPHSEGVWIFPQDLAVRRQVRGWRGTDPVIEYIAKGFGTLTPRTGRSVEGTSEYGRGRWSVVLRRGLASDNPEDATFLPGETTPLILAVWDGASDEVNGRKAVTYAWIPARFDGIGSATAKADVGVSDAARK